MLILDDFVYDPNASDSFAAEFTGGPYHLISGDIDRQTYQILTPGLAIGLRGTDIVVRVTDDGATDLAVLDGTATPTADGDTVDVNAGQIATGKPGDTTVVLTNGLPAFATTDYRPAQRNAETWAVEPAKAGPAAVIADLEAQVPAEPAPVNMKHDRLMLGRFRRC